MNIGWEEVAEQQQQKMAWEWECYVEKILWHHMLKSANKEDNKIGIDAAI